MQFEVERGLAALDLEELDAATFAIVSGASSTVARLTAQPRRAVFIKYEMRPSFISSMRSSANGGLAH